MQIEGIITTVLPIQEGTSQSGRAWRRLTFVITTPGQYPRTVAVQVMGGKIDEFRNMLVPGTNVKCDIDVSSSEYNGRWFTQVSAWNITADSNTPAQPAPADDPVDPFAAPQQQAPADPFAAPRQSSVDPFTGQPL